MNVPVVGMTGKMNSTLAKTAMWHWMSVDEEACPLGLAPTASTTATLAMGDALAVALLQNAGSSTTISRNSIPAAAWGGDCW